MYRDPADTGAIATQIRASETRQMSHAVLLHLKKLVPGAVRPVVLSVIFLFVSLMTILGVLLDLRTIRKY
jgi:hypothetical protein